MPNNPAETALEAINQALANAPDPAPTPIMQSAQQQCILLEQNAIRAAEQLRQLRDEIDAAIVAIQEDCLRKKDLIMDSAKFHEDTGKFHQLMSKGLAEVKARFNVSAPTKLERPAL